MKFIVSHINSPLVYHTKKLHNKTDYNTTYGNKSNAEKVEIGNTMKLFKYILGNKIPCSILKTQPKAHYIHLFYRIEIEQILYDSNGHINL